MHIFKHAGSDFLPCEAFYILRTELPYKYYYLINQKHI